MVNPRISHRDTSFPESLEDPHDNTKSSLVVHVGSMKEKHTQLLGKMLYFTDRQDIAKQTSQDNGYLVGELLPHGTRWQK